MNEIKTKNLLIKPFTKTNITKKYISWLNNKEVTKFSEQRHYFHTKQSCLEFYNNLRKKVSILRNIYK